MLLEWLVLLLRRYGSRSLRMKLLLLLIYKMASGGASHSLKLCHLFGWLCRAGYGAQVLVCISLPLTFFSSLVRWVYDLMVVLVMGECINI